MKFFITFNFLPRQTRMKHTQTLLRHSFNPILNSSLVSTSSPFCIYVFPYIFSSVASNDIYHWRIWHCYLFKWPSRVRSQIFQHHPFTPDPLFLRTFHSPSYFASTGNEKRPILASFIAWIYARLLFNKRFSLGNGPRWKHVGFLSEVVIFLLPSARSNRGRSLRVRTRLLDSICTIVNRTHLQLYI